MLERFCTGQGDTGGGRKVLVAETGVGRGRGFALGVVVHNDVETH